MTRRWGGARLRGLPLTLAGFLVTLPVTPTLTGAWQDSGQASAAAGNTVYLLYCASCHGTGARGDGPVAGAMRVRPADLTRIAARNGGRFPDEAVMRAVDGRTEVPGHGDRTMPVWGDALGLVKGGNLSPATARDRIESVVRYLATIQVP